MPAPLAILACLIMVLSGCAQIDSGAVTGSTTTSRSATFTFTSTEAGSLLQCSLDGSAWARCTSPKTYDGLANGRHTFRVQTDPAYLQKGDTNPPATRTWTVDAPINHTVTVTTQGNGAGTVTGPGISCPNDCSQSYVEGSSITLTATAAAGSTSKFLGWGGGCSGTSATCTISMTGAAAASAKFSLPAFTLRTGVQDIRNVPLDASPAGAIRILTNTGADSIQRTAVRVAEAKAAGIYPLPYMEENVASDDAWRVAITNWVTSVHSEVYEVGNEPAPDKWGDYFRRLAIAAPIIHAHGGKVILAASLPGVMVGYLRRAPFQLVDGVALHPYATSAQNSYALVQRARALVPANLPLYVTEVGWANHSGGTSSAQFVVSEARQASNLAATFGLLRSNAKSLNLRLISWFTYRDYVGRRTRHWWNYCGLRALDGRAKPALAALAAIARNTPIY